MASSVVEVSETSGLCAASDAVMPDVGSITCSVCSAGSGAGLLVSSNPLEVVKQLPDTFSDQITQNDVVQSKKVCVNCSASANRMVAN